MASAIPIYKRSDSRYIGGPIAPAQMKSPFLQIVCFPLLLLALLVCPAEAQQKKPNPSDVFLKGYLIMEDGMKMMQGEDYAGAYYKLKDAKDIFDSVFHSDPNWNPEIIEYRRKKVNEMMEAARNAEIQKRSRTAASGKTVNPVAPSAKDMSPPPPSALPMTPRTTDSLLQSKVAELQEQIRQSDAKRESLLKEIGSKEQQLYDMGARKVEAERNYQATLERLVEAKTQIETEKARKGGGEQESMKKEIASLKKEREEWMKKQELTELALKEANEQNAKLRAEMTDAYATIKSLGLERDKLIADRDQMNDLLAGDNSKSDKVKAMLAENIRLRKTMTELEGRIVAMQKERETDKKEIAGTKESMAKQREADQKLIVELRTQLETAQGELVRIKDENSDYQRQMAALGARLDASDRALAQAANPGLTESDALKENNLLHEIILKMIKQQSGRESAKRKAVAELEATGQMSEQLMKSLQEMAVPYQMTPAERALLNAAGAPKMAEDGSGINASMLSPELIAGSPKNENQPPPTEEVVRSQDELRAYATAAQRLFSDQNFVEAESNYEKILRAEPQNAGIRSNLAVTQIRQGKLDLAILNLQKSLAYKYDNDFPHYLLGAVYLRQNKLEEATEAINNALKINNQNAEGHFALGDIYRKQKRFTDAEREFKLAVEFDPSNADAHYNLAILYITAENPKKDLAKTHYKQAISHGASPDSNLAKLINSM